MQKERLFWPDFIRAVAILGVVLVHIVAPLVSRYGQLSPWRWGLALALGALARASVPLFFMLIGALYLGRELIPLPFLQKRASRLLLPFFFWSLLYDYQHLRPFTLSALWRSLLHIVQENTSGHLWFFYVLFGLYLVLPLLAVFVQHADPGRLRYYLALWLTATALLPLLDQITEIYPGIDLRLVSGYSGYLVLGYWLSRQPPRRRTGWALTGALALLAIFGLTWQTSAAAGQTQTRALDYLSLQVILWSAAAFVLLRAAAERFPLRWRPLIQSLSRASFGIYLVHVFFIRILERFQLHVLAFDGAPLAVLTLWLTVVLLSWAFTAVLQQIPFLRRLTP